MKEPSEKRFHAWLNKLDVAHVFIHSDQYSFAAAFRRVTKRSDFIIFPDGKKPYCVDVKEKRLTPRRAFSEPVFEIDESDVVKLRKFQKLYHMRVWLALTPDSKKDVWYFIDLYNVMRLPKRYHPGGHFVYVPVDETAKYSARRFHESSGGRRKAVRGLFINYLTTNSPEFLKSKTT
jgi:hypothetical protein